MKVVTFNIRRDCDGGTIQAFENRKLDMNNSVIEVTEEGAWQENK